jgi:hypothetical protein
MLRKRQVVELLVTFFDKTLTLVLELKACYYIIKE